MPPLPDGRPDDHGLDGEPIARAAATILDMTRREDAEAGPRPYAAVSGVLVHAGHVVGRVHGGWLATHDASGEPIPRGRRVPATTGTLFDLASLTKVVTTVVTLQLIDDGLLDLDAPVGKVLPELASAPDDLGRRRVTARHLLTHTAGLPVHHPIWRDGATREARLEAALRAPLQSEPGVERAYCDLGFIALGIMVERLRGDSLETVVRTRVTEPLGLRDTAYGPVAVTRSAASEIQRDPDRRLVHGEVHDENAWALGGVSGHAGLFSTADDLAVLGQCLVEGGSLAGATLLSPAAVALMTAPIPEAHPLGGRPRHTLGWDLDQPWFMGRLAGPRTIGHTGFTGTSLVLDLETGSTVVLLTNRVHPSRATGSSREARLLWADALAAARGGGRPRD